MAILVMTWNDQWLCGSQLMKSHEGVYKARPEKPETSSKPTNGMKPDNTSWKW